MNIEKEIFKNAVVDYKKLIKYGFKNNNSSYFYEKKFLNDDFKAIIVIDECCNISGKVIDLQTGDEYTNIKTKLNGQFVNKVRNLYTDILLNIKKNCFEETLFIYSQTNRVDKYIKEKYNSEPEFLWKKFPGFAIYRNKDNKKWYCIIMNLDKSKLNKESGEVEIINVKLGENKIQDLLKKNGYFEAYHMNKKAWITILLNDTIKDGEIFL